MSEIIIREAQPGDIRSVSDLLIKTWQATYENIYTSDQIADINRRWHNEDTLLKQLNASNQLFLVAEQGSVIKGHLLARYLFDRTILLRRLYIMPDVQGKGIGKKLYQQMLKTFPDAKSVRLEVEGQNLRALQFYRALGFVNVARTDDCGGSSGIPALIMERLLENV